MRMKVIETADDIRKNKKKNKDPRCIKDECGFNITTQTYTNNIN